MRVALGVPRCSRHTIANQVVAAMLNPAIAYTSVSFEFCHTVNVNAATSAAAAAPKFAHVSFGSSSDRARAVRMTMNKNAAAAALNTAVMRLTRNAYSPNGNNVAHACDRKTHAGEPGGCGTPRTFEAARYSPASQNVTVGASVTTYPVSTVTNTANAHAKLGCHIECMVVRTLLNRSLKAVCAMPAASLAQRPIPPTTPDSRTFSVLSLRNTPSISSPNRARYAAGYTSRAVR